MPLLSPHGKPQTTLISLTGAAAVATGILLTVWLSPQQAWIGWALAGTAATLALAGLAFFRDPDRSGPEGEHRVLASADGRISSIHHVDHYEPLGGPALCIRTFLSVLDVHVTRCPLAGEATETTHQPGKFLSALKPESADQNESTLTVFVDPKTRKPVYAIRHVAGAVARRIVCAAEPGRHYRRGERLGMMKFGSTTEVYLPDPDNVKVLIEPKQYVWAGKTVIAELKAALPSKEKPEAEVEETAVAD